MSDASSSHENLPSRSATGRKNPAPSSPVSGVVTQPAAAQANAVQDISSLPTASHRWLVFSLAILIAAAILWIMPHWQTAPLNLKPLQQLELENSLRDTWAKVISTFFLIIGAYFLWRYVEAVGKTVAAAERTVAAAEKNAAISQERHITERFVRVMELLGDEKLEVRLGGIYALERIARDSPADQSAVTEVLATYVREHAPWQEGQGGSSRVRADVQAILTVLGRRSWADSEEQPLDLHETALATAYLPFAKLQKAFLYEGNLKGAMLYRANLRGAWMWKAHLHNAILEGAHLEGADLTAAVGLTWEQVQQAHIDKTTKLPDYLRANMPDGLPVSEEPSPAEESAPEESAEETADPVYDTEALPTKRG